MPDCRIGDLLIPLVPVRFWRDALLERHIRRCSPCREGLAGIEEARSVTWSGEDFEGRSDLWPRVQGELRRAGAARTERPAFRRRWLAVSAAAAGLLAAAGVLLLKWDQGNGRVPASVSDIKLIIESSLIYDQPAQAYIFQTREEGTTFVWVEKTNQGEGP
ncbi:MAG: hypothetical protein FJY83_05365 [Candidatus Aminicenantes bacterium]|nr:hypothetical protein [Candidatus Aminicenantes bacterium]